MRRRQIAFFVFLCALPFASSLAYQQLLQKVRTGHHQAVLIEPTAPPEELAATGQGFNQHSLNSQSITTTVQDPAHPQEPWVITTYRRIGESMAAFIRRHRDMVDAVREVLHG